MLTIKTVHPMSPEDLAVLRHIQAATSALGTEYLLIGAKAIDLLLHNIHGLRTYRPTNDADFAVALDSWLRFDALKSRLIDTGEFAPVAHKYHRLEYKGKWPVDIIPFGGLESPPGTIAWPPDYTQIMNTPGFKEINTAAEEVALAGAGIMVRAASLPGLALLKLFAWADRRESRDASDIGTLIYEYNKILTEERLYKDEALLESAGYDMEIAGAALLGRDARKISNPQALSAMQNVFSRNEKDGGLLNRIAVRLRGAGREDELSLAEKFLEAFKAGYFK